MRRFTSLLAVAASLIAAPLGAQVSVQAPAPGPARPSLLPTPLAVAVAGDGFALTHRIPVVVSDDGARGAAAALADLMASRNVRLGTAVTASRSRTTIRFVRADDLPPEGYRLTTSATGAVVAASDKAGWLYGAVTLWQLATQAGREHHVAGVAITDAPRFGWRGLMLDSARHFQSPAYIRHLLDWMLANKLNRLHWHLVDDQGWRLPIPNYPRLTSVSAWRHPATAPGAPPLPATGGFYTADQIRGIVAYAAKRGITIVPEIEMPGHALSAIRAYPHLGMGVPIPPGTDADWGVFPWLYNTEPATFTFLEDVLRETMRLFPSRWVHVGGDEATKEQWHASPAIQAQIKRLGLKDEDALQGWFMARIGTFLAANGRRLVGWDEILDGGVPPDATITSWRGIDGAIKAAKSGHDAILSPAPTLYFDNRQGSGPEEPPGRGNLISLGDVLAFDPMPAGLSPDQRRHVLGVQANLWTEHVRHEDRAAWMTFPRAAAIAEIGWARAGKRDVADFATDLVPQLDRMAPLGLHAADSAFAVAAKLDRGMDGRGVKGRIIAALSGQSSLPIRYTLDGGAPVATSLRYEAPLLLNDGQRLRAATFLGDRALAGGYDTVVTDAAARLRTSRELTPCSNAVLLDLEDDYPATGKRAHFLLDIFHPCWRWNAAPVEGARRIVLSVGQLPFNFQVGADRAKIRFRAPATPAGEFVVHAGTCDGAPIATLPLAPALRNPGVTRLEAPLPAALASRDLCVDYTAKGVDPLWAIERVELLP